MADTNTLTTLVALKAWLGIITATDDAVLNYAIGRASRAVQEYCGRNFTSQRYFEIRDGGGKRITLYQTPVVSIRNVGIGWDNVLSVSGTDSTDVHRSVSVLASSVLLHRVTAAGSEVSTSATFASYPTTNLLAAYISTVTGFSASSMTNVDTRYLRKLGGRSLRTAAFLEAPVESCDDFQVDFDSGILYGDSLPLYRSVLVDYTAGYDVIPADVEQATQSMAGRMYHSRARDSSLASESLGGYSYSARSTETDLVEREMLANWRRPR